MTAKDAIPQSQGTDMRILNKPTIISALIIFLFIVPIISPRYQGLNPAVFAEELWQQEFMDICSKTDGAMSLLKDELKTLLQRGDKLRPVVDSLEETPRKIYLKRLQKCMNLYSFVLESKDTDKKQ